MRPDSAGATRTARTRCMCVRSRPSATRRMAERASTVRRSLWGRRAKWAWLSLGSAAVVAGDVGDHLDLPGGEAGEVGMRDQVVRVLVVAGVVHEVADVVHDRGGLEEQAVAGREDAGDGLVREAPGLGLRGEAVEDLRREHGDVAAVPLLVAAGAGETHDRAEGITC